MDRTISYIIGNKEDGLRVGAGAPAEGLTPARIFPP